MGDTLLADLRASVRGEVRGDDVTRALYATDASIYQIPPLAVVVPIDEADVAAALAVARRHGAAITPRGGATSLAGQTVGRSVHLDFTTHMRYLLELNVQESYAWVEPGMVLDELNALLAPHSLMFAPDISPGNRATIGGMVSNNSSGMYSLRYGKTIDHVLALRVLLADGSVATLGPLSAEELRSKLTLDSLEGRAYRAVRRLAREHAEEIEQRYPKLLRRVGGYNLDSFAQPGEARPFSLAPMVVGSEGTLAIILAAQLRLTPRPSHTGIGVLAFATLDAALDAVVPCLETDPAAVELMDDILLRLTRQSREYGGYLAQFVQGEPGALLQVEYFGATPAEVDAQLTQLESHLARRGVACAITRVTTPQVRQAVLQVRKAGLPLLQSISPDLRPETFVEDSAVDPARLAAYIRQFRSICHAEGVEVAFYGHASVGLMHARPLINLKLAEDVVRMRRIAEAVRDLVIEYGGSLSGEHGDGMLRGEFVRDMYGPQLYEAFRELKRTFDPKNILNPGKIVDAPKMDSNLRYGGGYHTIPLETHFRFADAGGMAGAAELCNGNGLCRKTASGTMCPSYMVTRDERHSTRGRANALRMVLSGALPEAELTSPRMKDVMDLCLECKGCTGECPSRVNMTRLKSEWLSRYYREHGVPLRTWLFGHINLLSRLAAPVAPLVNWGMGLPFAGLLAERLLGISRHRRLPAFASAPFAPAFRRGHAGGGQGRPTVVLFPDTFANYNDPHIAHAAVRVIERAGYRVVLPERQVCCGRPLISKGLLDDLRPLIAQQIEALAPYAEAGLPIVGLEPSCILTFRDEYPDLTDDPRVAAIARQTMLLDEFLDRELASGRARLDFAPAGGQFLLHGHCHQKALVGTQHMAALLRRIPGAQVREVDSGCCGMAGSFGYEAEHDAISRKIAERALAPAVRALPPDATVVAMGTSCRQQIADVAQRPARHLAEVLADALA
ncbi:FAD-binding protein [Chloroflexia bacterium SDU3-3]|nr:FAD-binding protein [Chloroflexia bacterium SDU3-3]